MVQEIFKRYEKKYLLTQTRYETLMDQLEGLVVPDEYGEYTTCNALQQAEDYLYRVIPGKLPVSF